MSPNVNVGINKAKEDGNTHQISHTGTKVVGTESVTIQSGQDTNIIGSQVQGEKVTATIGKNLNITSLQDVNDYTSKTKTAGMNMSIAPHMAPVISGSLGRQTMDSRYKSVTEQAGIYAGDSGLFATVENTTKLTGAIIDAKGSSHLKTKNLEIQDIQNEATYHTSGRNVGLSSTLKDAPKSILQTIPSLSIPVQGQADSVTRSAIVEAIVIEAEHSNRETLNKDTQEALNKLETIFNKKSVEERLALTNILASEGFKLIGDIAVKERSRLLEKVNRSIDDKEKSKYLKEANKWNDGGEYKVLLHGLMGSLVSKLSGGNVLTGFSGAAANESLQPALSRIKDDNVHKLASMAIGYIAGRGIETASISEKATEYNWLTHREQQDF